MFAVFLLSAMTPPSRYTTGTGVLAEFHPQQNWWGCGYLSLKQEDALLLEIKEKEDKERGKERILPLLSNNWSLLQNNIVVVEKVALLASF